MTTKHLLTTTVATLACSFTALAEISVKPAGLRIVWDSLSEELNFSTYNSEEVANFSFALSSTDKSFIAYDQESSKVMVKAGDQDLGGDFKFGERISKKDGKTMRVEVETEKLPTGNFDGFQVSGSINVLLASKLETESSELKVFKKGDKIKFGDDFSFEVKELGKPKSDFYKEPLEVTLEWKQDVSKLSKVRFYDAEGKLIESRNGGSSTVGFLGKRTVTRTYLLKEKSEKLKIEMDLWADIEKVAVPLEMNLGLSGAQK